VKRSKAVLVSVIGTVLGIVLGYFIAVWWAWDPAFVAGPVLVGLGVRRLLRRRGATPGSATIHALVVVVVGCLLGWAVSEALDAFGDAVGEYEG
jgi:hypothetical protein